MYVRGKGQSNSMVSQYFGGSYPARTWTAIMQALMADLPVEAFPPPAYVDGEAPGNEPGLVEPERTEDWTVSPTPTPTPTETPTGTPTGTPTSTSTPTSSSSPSSRKGRG